MKEKFYKAWNWAQTHHEWAIRGLDIEVVKVNPRTNHIDDVRWKNTRIVYWLENGPMCKDSKGNFECRGHDLRLDCGALTFEEAFLKHVRLIKKYYKKDTDFYGEKVK